MMDPQKTYILDLLDILKKKKTEDVDHARKVKYKDNLEDDIVEILSDCNVWCADGVMSGVKINSCSQNHHL